MIRTLLLAAALIVAGFESLLPPPRLRTHPCTCHPRSSPAVAAAEAETAEAGGENLVLTCGNCKASYEIDAEAVGSGRRVRCSNCGHQWYQTAMRLSPLPAAMELVEYPEHMKERIAAGLPAEPEAGFRAYVGNFPFGTSEETLRELFEPYGNVVGVDILLGEDGRPRGFGFVNLELEADGRKAIEELNGYMLNGRALTVSEGKSPVGRGGRGSRGRGGRGDFRGRGDNGRGYRGGRGGRGDGRGRGRGRGRGEEM